MALYDNTGCSLYPQIWRQLRILRRFLSLFAVCFLNKIVHAVDTCKFSILSNMSNVFLLLLLCLRYLSFKKIRIHPYTFHGVYLGAPGPYHGDHWPLDAQRPRAMLWKRSSGYVREFAQAVWSAGGPWFGAGKVVCAAPSEWICCWLKVPSEYFNCRAAFLFCFYVISKLFIQQKNCAWSSLSFVTTCCFRSLTFSSKLIGHWAITCTVFDYTAVHCCRENKSSCPWTLILWKTNWTEIVRTVLRKLVFALHSL